MASSPVAEAYPGPDAQCPNGWDVQTNTCLQSSYGPGGGRLDAECQATARFEACQRAVYVGCNSYGSAAGCRLLQLSYSDPNTFQTIMNAQRACITQNQQACAYLERYRGLYF